MASITCEKCARREVDASGAIIPMYLVCQKCLAHSPAPADLDRIARLEKAAKAYDVMHESAAKRFDENETRIRDLELWARKTHVDDSRELEALRKLEDLIRDMYPAGRANPNTPTLLLEALQAVSFARARR